MKETPPSVAIRHLPPTARPEENQYLATPLEVARDLPDDLLRLMGYQRGAYALGYVGDLLDPIAVLRPQLADHGFTSR